MSRRQSAAVVAALTILAALLRIPGLNSGFWFDELNTVVYSVRPPLLQVATAFPGDYTHPFYGVMAQAASPRSASIPGACGSRRCCSGSRRSPCSTC